MEKSGGENPHPALVKSLGGGLYEVRHVASEFGGRGIFCYEDRPDLGRKEVLLLVFRKESQKPPQRILIIARSRMEAVRKRK